MKTLSARLKDIRKNKKKGFTMIELIVVITILAILIAVVTPAVLGVIDSANRVADSADAQAIMMAAGVAALRDTDGVLPSDAEIRAQLAGDGASLHHGLVVDIFFEGTGVVGARIISNGRTTDSDGLELGAPGLTGAATGRVQVTIPTEWPGVGG